MLHNRPMAIMKSEIYKSTFKEKCISLGLSIFCVGMCAYCMYLITELPLPL